MPTRKNARLPEHDYSSSGKYFITICTYQKAPLLANLESEKIELTSMGQFIAKCIVNLQRVYGGIRLDTFIIMPNHIHAIITVLNQQTDENEDLPGLQAIVGNFKAFTAHEYYSTSGHRVLWQRGHFEHRIMDEKEMQRIRKHIITNPSAWMQDEYYLV